MFSELIILICPTVKRGCILSSWSAIASLHIWPRRMAFNSLIQHTRAAVSEHGADVFEQTYLFKWSQRTVFSKKILHFMRNDHLKNFSPHWNLWQKSKLSCVFVGKAWAIPFPLRGILILPWRLPLWIMHNKSDTVSLHRLAKEVLGCSTLLKNETFYLWLNIDLGLL